VEATRSQEVAANSIAHPLIELRELRYFAALADELHFGRAAERLHISQPPLSQTIANLERKLGTKLLERTSRQARLTSAGAVLREHALRVLADVERAINATRDAALAESRTLRITAAVPVREALLPQLSHRLTDRFPSLVLEVTEELANHVIASVLHGNADLGLAVCPITTGGIATHRVREEEPVALVHHDNPLVGRDSITLEELATLPLILWPRDESAGAHDFVVSLFDGAPPSSLTVLDRFDGGWWSEMVGGAYTIVPAGAATTPDYRKVPIADSESTFATDLIWSEQAPPPLLPALLEAIDELAEAEGWLRS
jgi:DNA-binding transcriptional LysR family regulator